MKTGRLALFFTGLLMSATSFGQVYVDGTPIDTLDTPYCQLIGVNGSMLTRPRIIIDDGKHTVPAGLNRQKIAGPDRQPITFGSTVDALNFMVRQGWELVSFSVAGTGNASGTSETFVYLLQRKRKIAETPR